MKQLVALLLLAAASLPLAAKWKVKDKAFEPVAMTDVRQIEGRYVGIDPDYVIALRVSDEGTISGTIRSFGQTATLRNIRIDGAEFTAMAAVDGARLPLHATFVNRLRDGASTFGLMVHDAGVQFDEVTLSQIFCRRM